MDGVNVYVGKLNILCLSRILHEQLNVMMSALSLLKIKPQNLIDWGSESAIDPINPLVYILKVSCIKAAMDRFKML